MVMMLAVVTVVALTRVTDAAVPRLEGAGDALALTEVVLLGWAAAFAVIIRSGASE
jgi:hypothetical protein